MFDPQFTDMITSYIDTQKAQLSDPRLHVRESLVKDIFHFYSILYRVAAIATRYDVG